ncbi:ATP synthase subunit delta, mitochondrial-like [Stylophora pistillata]|uniref:F-ATPase delta subunit n=1 Tax=Stylophora pistillata TaxID=50429 RepID=A0A2B4SN13_STYPI|nr:ATP synthase subunit delta, mitochondrial-like [Stylophora pistillata]PFX30756.1 ATP synthase subunit delta, mitochondrial [Stylophora pistillata]
MLGFITRQAPRLWRQPGSLILRRSLADGAPAVSLTFGSPSESFYSEAEVKQVDVATTAGSFGILPNHVPTLATLRPGLLTVTDEEGVHKYFASSGTVTINDDSTVQILAEEAHPIDRFDPQAVTQQLDQAQQSLSSAASEEDKAKAQIAVECLDALNKALGH